MMPPMRKGPAARVILAALPVAFLLVGRGARAQAVESSAAAAVNPDLDVAPTRRSGAVLGLTVGGGMAGASGYPNDAKVIGNPADYSSSGFMYGRSFELVLMGALTDYLNFGLWIGSATFENGDFRSTGIGGGFRVEVFPLFYAYPSLKDLGVFGHFGVGHATLDVKAPGYPSDDGTQSFLGGGVFYEWSLGRGLGGHFALGPSLEYDDTYSRSIDRHGLLATARFVFYGGR
jgi:hypothetical protein